MTDNADIIHYDTLLTGYNDSLTTVLRGFRPGLGFLETWVPDEDLVKSVLNLLEEAHDAGRKDIAVRFGPESAALLDTPQLLQLTRTLGTARIRPEGDGLLLEMSYVDGASE